MFVDFNPDFFSLLLWLLLFYFTSYSLSVFSKLDLSFNVDQGACAFWRVHVCGF